MIQTLTNEPDLAEALEIVNHDIGLLKDIFRFFIEDHGVLLREIRRAIAEKNGELLIQNAHKLKGMLMNVAAREAPQKSTELLEMGRSQKWEGSEALCDQLETCCKKLVVFMEDYIIYGNLNR